MTNTTPHNKLKLLAVSGPTGSGKSALSVELALYFHGQVISCDAMQIYRGMDVGTGKVTSEETRGVRHRMLDIADPCAVFSLGSFIERARRQIEETAAEGYLPILCGGTGLYLDRLLDGTTLCDAPGDDALRKELEEKTNEELYGELLRVDPESARITHQNNRKRVIRALEIYRLTGETKSALDERSRRADKPYDALRILILPRDRAALYAAIDRRVEKMFDCGLEAEARALFAGEVSETAAQAIGYKEFLPYFKGEGSLESVKEKIKQASRNYAKRQLTWFAREKDGCLVVDAEAGTKEKFEAVKDAAASFLR